MLCCPSVQPCTSPARHVRRWQAAIAIVKDRPNVQHIDLSLSQCVTVVGDLHGQLDDLCVSCRRCRCFRGDMLSRVRRVPPRRIDR